ncbi:MAG: integrase core domain-containing protein [Bacteroidota bacterium]
MPWKSCTAMEEKKNFIYDWLSGQYSKSELCRAYGISRPTGDLLIKKYNAGGLCGLVDRRKTPHFHPLATDEEVIAEIIRFRKKHPKWGARKIRELLLREWSSEWVPSAQTINKILRRSGLIIRQKRRPRVRPLLPNFDPESANEIWSADYKGKFKMGDKKYCHPLTICDSFSRYLFVAKGHYRETFKSAKPVFKRIFEEYGLPKQLHTDNGAPFASIQSPKRYGRLSYWLMDLDIEPVFSDPASPQQNGRHERMHKDLKAQCARPSSYNLRSQQRKLNEFVEEYNKVRPHESLAMKTPSEVHQLSPREMPKKIREWEYPSHFKVKRVTKNGSCRWGSYEFLKISVCAADKYIGLEEQGNGIWLVYYRRFPLGYFHQHDIVEPGKYHNLRMEKV